MGLTGQDRDVVDPVEALIKAWIAWEDAPASHQRAAAKCDALNALGLPANQIHEQIGAWRRAGYSIPDAIQSVINQHKPQEAA